MKINRNVSTDKDKQSLISFYNNKAKEKGGGYFFKVYRKGMILFTEWATSVNELRAFLVTNDIKFDKINPLK